MKAGTFCCAIPSKRRVSYGENQAGVVAIAPGVRTFTTFHSTESCGFLGSAGFSRIQRMAPYLGNVLSRAAKAGNQKTHNACCLRGCECVKKCSISLTNGIIRRR